MDDYLKKGRSLQLEGLAQAPIKVTVGFKCEGKDKITLAQEAHQSAMTLSEYVEYLVSLRHRQSHPLRVRAVKNGSRLPARFSAYASN